MSIAIATATGKSGTQFYLVQNSNILEEPEIARTFDIDSAINSYNKWLVLVVVYLCVLLVLVRQKIKMFENLLGIFRKRRRFEEQLPPRTPANNNYDNYDDDEYDDDDNDHDNYAWTGAHINNTTQIDR